MEEGTALTPRVLVLGFETYVVDQLPPRNTTEDGEDRPLDRVEVAEQVPAQRPVDLPPTGQEAGRDDRNEKEVQHEGPPGQPSLAHTTILVVPLWEERGWVEDVPPVLAAGAGPTGTGGPARGEDGQLDLTAVNSLVSDSLASPKSRVVFGSYSRALSTPEKPGRILRFKKMTLAALSTFKIGIP